MFDKLYFSNEKYEDCNIVSLLFRVYIKNKKNYFGRMYVFIHLSVLSYEILECINKSYSSLSLPTYISIQYKEKVCVQ